MPRSSQRQTSHSSAIRVILASHELSWGLTSCFCAPRVISAPHATHLQTNYLFQLHKVFVGMQTQFAGRHCVYFRRSRFIPAPHETRCPTFCLSQRPEVFSACLSGPLDVILFIPASNDSFQRPEPRVRNWQQSPHKEKGPSPLGDGPTVSGWMS